MNRAKLFEEFGLSEENLQSLLMAIADLSDTEIVLRLGQIKYLLKVGAIKSRQEAQELLVTYPRYLSCSFEILYENDDLVVINKPCDVRVDIRKVNNVPGKPNWDTEMTVAEWFKQRYPFCSRVWLCHQLDYATSGILVLAKTRHGAAGVGNCFEKRTAQKEYEGLVLDIVNPSWNGKTVQFYITDDSSHPFKMQVHRQISRDTSSCDKVTKGQTSSNGKLCTTHVNIVSTGVIVPLSRPEKPFRVTHLRLKPITGRRHQLRLLASHIMGHPILGDETYGDITPFYRLNCTGSSNSISSTLQSQHELMATLKRAVASELPGEKSTLRRTVYVGGLDENVDKTILQAAFIPFGDIRTTEIPKDRLTGKHRGFGFVEFEEEEDAEHAVDNMHEAELFGRVLTVNLARTGARTPGEGKQPIWKNDIMLRQQLTNAEPTEDEREQMAALLQISEVQEVFQTEELQKEDAQAD